MLPKKIAFVDIETTGCSLVRNRVIEIGVLRVENNKLVDTFQTLVNPDTYLPPEIVDITGITSKDLENAPRFSSIKRDLMDILKDCTFAAHNVRFDYGFLKNELRRESISFRSRHFCTCRLSQKLYPQYRRHNLTTLIERFNFSCQNRHRAFDDAKILWDFYQKIQEEFSPEVLESTFKTILKRPSTPPRIDEKVLDDLPESPGVYIFYGDTQTPLYVGKSVNIKERVLNHFVNDATLPGEMKIAQQVTSIQTYETVGELGALFKEAELIKELTPIYNKKLRNKRSLIAITAQKDESGYLTAKIEPLTSPNQVNPTKTLGIVRTKKSAKELLQNVAKENALCLKLLGLEKTKSQCFAYSLGQCKGACLKKEPPLIYNLRFETAFIKTRIRPWPFKGPILIEETNEINGISEGHIIDNWSYKGKIIYREGMKDIKWNKENAFDLDSYNIIRQALRSKKGLKIREITVENE